MTDSLTKQYAAHGTLTAFGEYYLYIASLTVCDGLVAPSCYQVPSRMAKEALNVVDGSTVAVLLVRPQAHVEVANEGGCCYGALTQTTS